MIRWIHHSHKHKLTCYEKHSSEPTAHPAFPILCQLWCLHGHVSRTSSLLWGHFWLEAAWLLGCFCQSLMCSWTAADTSPAIPGPSAHHAHCCAGGWRSLPPQTSLWFYDSGAQVLPAPENCQPHLCGKNFYVIACKLTLRQEQEKVQKIFLILIVCH